MSAIAVLEQKMLAMEQVDIPVTHRFGPHMYMREITVPAGVTLLGHDHKTDHVSMLLEGRITLTDECGSVSELKAPMILSCKPGRKVAFVHEKMVWVNIHVTDETDIDKLEQLLIVKSSTWINHQKSAIPIASEA